MKSVKQALHYMHRNFIGKMLAKVVFKWQQVLASDKSL